MGGVYTVLACVVCGLLQVLCVPCLTRARITERGSSSLLSSSLSSPGLEVAARDLLEHLLPLVLDRLGIGGVRVCVCV